MAKTPGVWGIDIGQCALKAIRLEVINGWVKATAFDYVEHPKILSRPDADPNALIKEALEKFLSRNSLQGDLVATSVPGQSGLARFVKLPPVEEKKIPYVMKFEAMQQIPFSLEEVVWDYQTMSDGGVIDGFAVDTEIGLFAMKRDMIQRFIGYFLGADIEIHFVQMAPLALCNYITYDLLKRGGPDALIDLPATIPGKRHCTVALDMGTDGSNLIITDGVRLIWQRPIHIGGNHFTNALVKELKLTFADAELFKKNAGDFKNLANYLRIVKPIVADFTIEIQRSLGYFTHTHRDAQLDYLVGLGGGFQLLGLRKYLADTLQLQIRETTEFERLAGAVVTTAPKFIENFLSFPVAYGLALQGLGVAHIGINLLPPEIASHRKIKIEKFWALNSVATRMLGKIDSNFPQNSSSSKPHPQTPNFL